MTTTEQERSFLGKLASAKRTLRKANPAMTNPYMALAALREGQDLTSWLLFGLVSVEGEFIPAVLSDEDALPRLKAAGPIRGAAGLVRIGDRVTTFVQPFAEGDEVAHQLTAVMEEVKQDMFAEMRRRGEGLGPDLGPRKAPEEGKR